MLVVYFPTINKVLFVSLASPSQAVWITLQSAARLKHSGRFYFLHELVRGIRVWGTEEIFQRANHSFWLILRLKRLSTNMFWSCLVYFSSLKSLYYSKCTSVCVSVCIVYNMLIAKHKNISVSLQEQATAPSSCLQRAVCWLNRRCCTGGRRMCGATLDHV